MYLCWQSKAVTGRLQSVWDDFKGNGDEVKLDDLDCLFRGIAQRDVAPARLPTSIANQNAEDMQDIITKANLIDILREREQLQRVARGVASKRSISGATPTSRAKVLKVLTPTTMVCQLGNLD